MILDCSMKNIENSVVIPLFNEYNSLFTKNNENINFILNFSNLIYEDIISKRHISFPNIPILKFIRSVKRNNR